ncbi:MAG: ATP-binding protein [bacterium]|nr:ATP-binding protein [bacterium]
MDHSTCFETIARRYAGGRERLFILHGNTRDLFPGLTGEERVALRTLPDALYAHLSSDLAQRASRIWMHYGVGHGTRFMNSEADGVARMMGILGAEINRFVAARKPVEFFGLLDEVCQGREKIGYGDGMRKVPIPLRVIVTEAQLTFPNAPTHFLQQEDRALLARLRRFAIEPAYDDTNTLLVLVTDSLTDLHPELREVAVTLELSRPNEETITAFLAETMARRNVVFADGADGRRTARLAVGLTRRQVETIAVECAAQAQPLTSAVLEQRRAELIRRDYGDLLEFIEPRWTLDDVGGHALAVAELRTLAAALARGDRDIPSGIIVGGQNGVGKTHLLTGFAGTAGVTVAVLKPFKSSGYGESEKAWGRIATALTSAGQIIVIVQEADAALGQRTGQNVHEVSKLVLVEQLKLMGDPAYRGKILWLLDTCRPDKLVPDVKRPGRAERMIPLFPETEPARIMEILRVQVALLTRNQGYEFADGFLPNFPDQLLKRFIGKTGAQIARALQRAKRLAREEETWPITSPNLHAVVRKDTLFDAEPRAYELQRLIAIAEAIETDNADLVPQHYLDPVKRDGIAGLQRTIEELRRVCDVN